MGLIAHRRHIKEVYAAILWVHVLRPLRIVPPTYHATTQCRTSVLRRKASHTAIDWWSRTECGATCEHEVLVSHLCTLHLQSLILLSQELRLQHRCSATHARQNREAAILGAHVDEDRLDGALSPRHASPRGLRQGHWAEDPRVAAQQEVPRRQEVGLQQRRSLRWVAQEERRSRRPLEELLQAGCLQEAPNRTEDHPLEGNPLVADHPSQGLSC